LGTLSRRKKKESREKEKDWGGEKRHRVKTTPGTAAMGGNVSRPKGSAGKKKVHRVFGGHRFRGPFLTLLERGLPMGLKNVED